MTPSDSATGTCCPVEHRMCTQQDTSISLRIQWIRYTQKRKPISIRID